MMEEVRVIAPTGCLGYGFSKADFERCLAEFKPHVIGVDAGSTDPGPYYLGAGKSFTDRLEVAAELETIIGGGLRHGIPVIVGSSGGAGADAHVRWVRGIVEDLAEAKGWSFSLATISAELSTEFVLSQYEAGRITEFEADRALSAETISETSTVVGQMGVEPLVAALGSGADVILAGRSCDNAIFAAYPIMQGFDRGLSLHMGKILECGAQSADPFGDDVMMATVRADHFVLEPGSLDRRCTPVSVAAQCLYEVENPYLEKVPGGATDLGETSYEQLDERRVLVRGSRFAPAERYYVKLEGVKPVGFRTLSIAGMRCPVQLEHLDLMLDEAIRRTEEYVGEIGVERERYHIEIHQYGRGAVMKELEPEKSHGSTEVGLVLEVTAETQELAAAICHHLSGALLHVDFEGQFNTAGNLAFPYSPSEMDLGEAFEFSLYDLLEVDDPLSLFPIEISTVGAGPTAS